MTVVSALLISTTVGALLVPLIAQPLYYWTTGFEYGHLAHKYAQQLETAKQKKARPVRVGAAALKV